MAVFQEQIKNLKGLSFASDYIYDNNLIFISFFVVLAVTC